MENIFKNNGAHQHITFKVMSLPARALATCIIISLGLGMLGAIGQIVIHDIIPTFYSGEKSNKNSPETGSRSDMHMDMMETGTTSERGDLFAELTQPENPPVKKPFYAGEQFVWTLKWTHIHLFGMGMIFIFMGAISLFLDAGIHLRTWLIVLPFVGILIDIAAMWLKGFISPAFFWLHMPGGGIFGLVFIYVSLRALYEMWFKHEPG
jgi:hypothetical protein